MILGHDQQVSFRKWGKEMRMQNDHEREQLPEILLKEKPAAVLFRCAFPEGKDKVRKLNGQNTEEGADQRQRNDGEDDLNDAHFSRREQLVHQ